MLLRRSRAREVALQLLFQHDLNQQVPRAAVERFAGERLRDAGLEAYCLRLRDGAVDRQADVDAAITKAASNWRLPRMAAVDRNILRVGTFEILFGTDGTPAAVCIDEAVELARRFGSANSTGFVNGVLDRVARDAGKLSRRG